MNIRTKVITTIIAMVCSLSVSVTGIVAVAMSFETQVESTTSLNIIESMQADLIGERYGANNDDLVMQHLFKNGEGEQPELEYFCRDVNFSQNSDEIVYIFKLILAQNSDSGVIVSLSNVGLSNSILYTAKYNVAYGKAVEASDWANAPELKTGEKYFVTEENPYLWIRASLKINGNTYARISTEATWTFTLNFEAFELGA